jgi:hypothetical protein
MSFLQDTADYPIVGAAPTAATKRVPATVAVDSLLAERETPVTPLETNTRVVLHSPPLVDSMLIVECLRLLAKNRKHPS